MSQASQRENELYRQGCICFRRSFYGLIFRGSRNLERLDGYDSKGRVGSYHYIRDTKISYARGVTKTRTLFYEHNLDKRIMDTQVVSINRIVKVTMYYISIGLPKVCISAVRCSGPA